MHALRFISPKLVLSLLVTALLSLLLGTAAAQEVKLLPSDGEAEDIFGSDVSISGEGSYALVGAQGDNDTGSVYVFVRTGSMWAEQAKLVASDAETSDSFGANVAISADGSYALVGAANTDDAGSSSGSAYVFVRTGSTWTEQAKLTASDGAASDFFGIAVAISADGSVALVGASLDDDNGSASGSAYLFVRTGSTWTEQAKLTASNGVALDGFGRDVALSGDGTVALVGASGPDILASGAGSAYVFVPTGSTWTEQARLTASDGTAGDAFGRAVALNQDGTYALIGAAADDDTGSAYTFTRSGTVWNEQAKLSATDAASGDAFGTVVSISADGDRALIGAFADDDEGSLSGSAYLFARSGAAWTQEAKLTASDAAMNDQFGDAVALSADGAYSLIGADGDDDNGDVSGSAYVFPEGMTTAAEDAALPATPLLSPPSPNPFRQQTRLTLTLAETQTVTVAVYDVLGRRVALLHDGTVGAGTPLHLAWGEEAAASGLYVVRAEGETFRATQRVTCVR